MTQGYTSETRSMRLNFRLIFIWLGMLLFPALVYADTQDITWRQVPLREKQQERAGIGGGEGLQYVYAIAYAPSAPHIVYMATDTSQIWKSCDGGSTWVWQHKGFAAHGARSLLVDPRNHDIVFAAGFLGQGYEQAIRAPKRLQGIFRTVDGGQNWKLVKKTDFFAQESKGCLFAFIPGPPREDVIPGVYCGSYHEGLLHSGDGGTTWETIALPGIPIIDMKEDPAHPGNLIIATPAGLFRYSPQTTVRIGKGLPHYPYSLAISPQNPTIVYAAVGKHGVYKSFDGGAIFSPSNRGLRSDLNYTDISVSPLDTSILYLRAHLTGLRPFYSHDGGTSWHMPITTNSGGLLANEGFYFSSPFAPHPREKMTCLSASNGKSRIIKTTDAGVNWAYSGNGFCGGRMSDIAFEGEHMLVALTDHGLWLTENKGQIFRQLQTQRIMGLMSSRSCALRDNTIVASLGSWSDKGLVVSHDTGRTWSYFPDLIDRYVFIAMDPTDPDIIYAGPFRSFNKGRTWSRMPHAVQAAHSGKDFTLYAVEPDGKKACRIVSSNDSGDTWQRPYPSCRVSSTSVQALAVGPQDQDILYLATASGLWIFRNGAWRRRADKDGLALDAVGDCYISSLAIDPRKPDILYAGRRSPGYGQSNGIFRSRDGGLNWHNITGNLGPEITIWAIKIDPQDRTVYIGTSQGTWKLAHQDICKPSAQGNK